MTCYSTLGKETSMNQRQFPVPANRVTHAYNRGENKKSGVVYPCNYARPTQDLIPVCFLYLHRRSLEASLDKIKKRREQEKEKEEKEKGKKGESKKRRKQEGGKEKEKARKRESNKRRKQQKEKARKGENKKRRKQEKEKARKGEWKKRRMEQKENGREEKKKCYAQNTTPV